MGPCTNDVRTEGGGGLKNCPILRTNSSDRLREMRTRGRGGGVKNAQNFADVICTWPPVLILSEPSVSQPLVDIFVKFGAHWILP